MAEQTFSIEFEGYWREEKKKSISARSGIYCVYECTHNKKEGTVSIHKLIYIGEAGNVKDRIDGHEQYEDWKKHVRKGNELCFSFGGVSSAERERCEAAMIFKHKPPENTEYKNAFPFDKTTMNLSGKIALLIATFTVTRT